MASTSAWATSSGAAKSSGQHVEPAKRRPGYANFAITNPPLKLVLIEGQPDQDTRLDHLGVEVQTTDEVSAATQRLADAGLATFEENDTTCCYALQDKVWVHGPGQEPWEVYVVKADADQLTKATETGDTCCSNTGPQSVEITATVRS